MGEIELTRPKEMPSLNIVKRKRGGVGKPSDAATLTLGASALLAKFPATGGRLAKTPRKTMGKSIAHVLK